METCKHEQAFGQVYLALDLNSGAEFAVKQVEIHSDAGQDSLRECEALEREVLVLQRLSHIRIVRYYGTERTDTFLAIFMEYVPGRSVHSRLRVRHATAAQRLATAASHAHPIGCSHRWNTSLCGACLVLGLASRLAAGCGP
jgi:serine/threonine protein kinase